MGPLWLDIAGCELDALERELLAHPTIGGVILFSRNFYDSAQLQALTKSIRVAAKRPILIGVDQEGGRVQRFKAPFTAIPAAQSYARLPNGEDIARIAGWVMAAELIAHDIDLSFAPVLDKGFICKAIGSRAFGDTPDSVIRFSSAFIQGMKSAGMATTGKHFPGHGAIITDSHYETPIDNRQDIAQDLEIFKAHIAANLLDAMMPAHVIYPHFDPAPASGSAFWLKHLLREQLQFKGIIFSDDLNMAGAHVMGSATERCQQALAAGCDMLLLCNNRHATIEVLDNLRANPVALATSLIKRKSFDFSSLKVSAAWQDAQKKLNTVCADSE